MTAWIGLVILILAALVLMLRGDGQPIAGLDPGEFASIMTGLALIIAIGGGTLLAYRGRATQAVKDIATWMAILLALVTVYSFRGEFRMLAERVGGELAPGLMPISRTGPGGETVVEIPRRTSDHFVVRARINGAPVELLFDTGASSVVLTSEDAARVGLAMERLAFSLPVMTANGRTFVAPVQLRAVAVGDIAATNVEAAVARPGDLGQSLLGMSFLSRLRSYEVRDGVLILRD